jgi:hypothetical protein
VSFDDAIKPPDAGAGLFEAMGKAASGEWFGPGSAPNPMAQIGAEGRAFDFTTGYNLQVRPKVYEGVTFTDLRNLSDGYDLLRLVIETRKDQIEKLGWDIKKREEKIVKKGAAPDTRIKKIRDFLAYPDKERPFGTWLRMLAEDLLVIDAPSVYVRRTRGGDLFALETIDGATIKRILDPTGRTPLDGPAYQQILKGVAACDYTRDELLYMPRNPRTHKAFGYGPVEQVMTTVNIALRRQLHQLSYYSDGNTPNLIFGVPKEWNPAQVKQFQEWWDSMLAGNSQQRARARFVPGEIKPFDTKEHALKDDYDEWLARIICFAFSISPTSLVKETNRATAQTVQAAALSEGLAPMMNWVKALLDRILRDVFEAPDLEFVWEDERSLSPKERAEVDQIDVASSVRTVDECREDRGLEPLPKPEPVPTPLLPAPGTVPPPAAPGKEAEPGKAGDGAAQPTPAESTKAACACGHDHVAKAAKVKPIKRDRKSVQKLETKLQKTVAAHLKAQIQPIAEAIHAELGKAQKPTLLKRFRALLGLQKMSSEEARKILESLAIDMSALGDDLEPILAAIAQDGGAQALAQLGRSTTDLLDQVNEKAVAWAEQHAADLVTQIEETTRKSLQGDLAAAIDLGMSVDDISAVISKDYGFSDRRADLIATTERRFADVRGNTLGYAESGVVKGLQWICANGGTDDRTCADCEMNDGAAVGMDADGNATEAFPSGATTVPAHPGCLCDLLPVLSEEE